ncbi:hypothetical protein JCM11641_003216 [Rhodosporidiobolus odoratus]
MEGQADETVHDSAALEATYINPVASTSAEAEAYGQGVPPEMFPNGQPGTLEGGDNTFAGHDEAERVKHANDGMPQTAEAQPVPGDATLPEPPREIVERTEHEEQEAGDDLFGDDGDDDDAMQADSPRLPTPPPQQEDYEGLTAEEAAARKRLEYDEDDDARSQAGSDVFAQQTIEQEQRFAQVPFANVSVPPGGKVWHTRLPGFLKMVTNPFDEKAWEPKDLQEDEQAETQEGEERKPRVRVADENVIRWRWTRDELGEVIKQSNARILRWSDGTLSLQLGSELFDLSLSLDHSAILTGPATSLPPTAATNASVSLSPSAFDSARSHSLTYLTARHGYNGHLAEAQASIYGTIGMRPATLHGKTHKKLAGAIANRNVATKGRAVKAINVYEDPELARQEREKREAEKVKKAKKEQRKAAGKGGRGGKKQKKATTIEGLDSDDDGEEEEGEGGYGGRRSQTRGGRNRGYSDDDDEGFLAQSDDDMAISDDGRDQEIEEADDRLEREARKKKNRDRQKQRDVSTSPEVEKADSGAVKRRMVVESDEE